jgi:hypothetical protein
MDLRSYRDADSYRSSKSGREYYSDRNSGDERITSWFRDSRSYDEPDRGDSPTVSPRYYDSARKFFESYEASRNTEAYRGYTGSKDSGSSSSGYSSPKTVEPRGSGAYSGKSYSSPGRSATGSARTASPKGSPSGAHSVKKPH